MFFFGLKYRSKEFSFSVRQGRVYSDGIEEDHRRRKIEKEEQELSSKWNKTEKQKRKKDKKTERQIENEKNPQALIYKN